MEEAFIFPKNRCQNCSKYRECFNGKKNRTIFIHKNFELLLKAEKYSKTEEYRNEMKLRARIEAKQNELVNVYGLRRTRYKGQRKLAFAARMRALASNFQRINRLLNCGKLTKEQLNIKDTVFKNAA